MQQRLVCSCFRFNSIAFLENQYVFSFSTRQFHIQYSLKNPLRLSRAKSKILRAFLSFLTFLTFLRNENTFRNRLSFEGIK